MQDVEERLGIPAEDSGVLLSTVAGYALGAGGKRIRPALLLLAARAAGADACARGVTLASATEMMHAATLLHDDIVDHAPTRRVDLYKTVNVRHGRDTFRAAVLHYDIENQSLIAESDAGRRVYVALVPRAGRTLSGDKP
jgi:octaprenyl-diphosphate synthase